MCWSIGLKNATLSLYPTLSSLDKKTILTDFFILLNILGLITSLLVFFNGQELFKLFGFNKLIDIRPFAVFVFLSFCSIVTEVILILKEKSRELLLWGILSFTSLFILIFLTAMSKNSTEGIFLILAYWAFFRYLYTLLAVIRFSGWKPRFYMIRRLLIFALPLILTVFMGYGMEYIDAWIVGNTLGIESFAIFKYGARELPLVTLVIGALVGTSIPKALDKNSPHQVKAEVRKLMRVIYPVACLIMLLSPVVFPLIYSDAFIESAVVFNVYLLIIISRFLLPQIYLLANHYTKTLLIVTFFELLLNLSLSLLLVESFGLAGIAFATFMAFLIQKMVLVFLCKKKLNIGVSQYIDLKSYGLYSMLLMVCFIISMTYL